MDRIEVAKKEGKKEFTEQARSIKDLLYGCRGKFSCGTQRIVPSVQDSARTDGQGEIQCFLWGQSLRVFFDAGTKICRSFKMHDLITCESKIEVVVP